MKMIRSRTYQLFLLCTLSTWLVGCASTETSSPANSAGVPTGTPSRYKTTDGRNIDIGPAAAAEGGRRFRNPHLEKCWVADNFNFTGYDTLYIVPTQSTAKYQKDEERPHQLAKESLPLEFTRSLNGKGIFENVVTRETDIKTNAHVLKLENTITEYSKGGGGARYFVGLYGGGQPALRVQGKLMDGDKPVFLYEARRSGVSAGARLGGAFMKDEDIQIEDIRSMVLDLSDFMSAVAGKYQARN
jgi:hypothetical protein